MEQSHRSTDSHVTSALQSEAELIAGAVRMVATGGSTRVTVAGLRFGEALLEQARREASGRGVRVEPRWSTDESGGVDIVVEPLAKPADR